jgi:hypothetical protein
MSVLKWLLIIVGVLFLAFLAIVVGGYYWASNVETVKITAEDIKVGGPYPDDERQALVASCKKNIETPASEQDECACIAEKAGTDLSRFERLALTAGFEGSASKIVGLTKGLIGSGLPQAEIDAMEANSKTRIDSVLKACGVEQDS